MTDSQDKREDLHTAPHSDAAQPPETERRRVLSEPLRKEYKPKKRSNRAVVIILLVVLLAVAAGGVYLASNFAPPPEEVQSTTVKIFDYTTEDIERVDIELREGESYTVTYDAANKTYAIVGEPSGIAYSQGSLRDVYSAATQLSADKVVEEDVQDMSPYGLDKPYATMTVHHNSGQSFVIDLGNKLPTGSGWYLRQQDSNTVYTVSDGAGTRMSRTKGSMRDLALLPSVKADTAEYILIQKRDGQSLELKSEASAISINNWQFVEPAGLEADGEAVLTLSQSIAGVKLKAYVDTPADLAAYGLSEPAATVTLRDTDGNTLTFDVGDAATDTTTYVRLPGSQDVYTMENSVLSFVNNTTPVTLVVKFAGLINISAVDEVTITPKLGVSDTLSIERKRQLDETGKVKTLENGEIDYKETYFLNGRSVDESPFKKVYQEIIGITINGEVKGEITGQPAYTLDYVFNSEADTMRIEFIPYMQDFYAIRKNDAPVLFYTRREKVDALASYVSLLANTPLSADAGKVSELLITKGGETTTYTRAELGDEKMTKMVTSLLEATTSGITRETPAQTEITVELRFPSDRAPVIMEYASYPNSMYSFAPQGQSARYLISKSTLERNLEPPK